MIKFVKISLIGILGLFLLMQTSNAVEEGAFARIGVGARPLGMGGAFVAVADDANSVYWNPAGLTSLKGMEFTSMYSQQLGIIDYNFLAFASPFENIGNFGISWIGLSADTIYSSGVGTYSENTIAISYGREVIPNLSVGVNLKFLSVSATKTSSGFGLDIGAQYRAMDKLEVGLMIVDPVSNIKWQESGTSESLKSLYILGMAYEVIDGLTLACDIENLDFDKLHLGAEYWYFYPQLACLGLRAGSDRGNLAVGATLKIENFGFDYAFMSHDIGNSHRISVGARF